MCKIKVLLTSAGFELGSSELMVSTIDHHHPVSPSDIFDVLVRV